jgi:hypothetical protein
MSFVTTKGKFHVALDGVGLLLQGSTERPAITTRSAPVYGTRFASGDRDYNDLSQWWYFLQTDWSGGFKNTVSWEDDAKFYYSTNIDVWTEPGLVKLGKDTAQEFDNSGFGALAVYDAKLVFYNDADNLLYIDADNVRQDSDGAVVASGGTSDVYHICDFKNYLWLFYNGSSGVRNWDGTTESDKTALIESPITGAINRAGGGLVIGGTLYILTGQSNGYISISKTTVANPTVAGDFSLVWETEINVTCLICGFGTINGKIIVLVGDATGTNVAHLYSIDIATGIGTIIKEWSSNVTLGSTRGKRYVQLLGDKLLITVPSPSSDNDGEIYTFDGSSLTKVFSTDEVKNSIGKEADVDLEGGCVIAGNYAYWGNLVYDGESFFNLNKDNSDSTTNSFLPIGYNPATDELMFKSTSSGQVVWSMDVNGTSYKDGASESAFLVFSQHDKLQSIDKLLNSITIGFKGLATGQSIEVYYTTSETPATAIGSWTSVGTASNSVDGSSMTYKTFRLPDGVVAKKIWFRVNLKSTSSGTPYLTDFTAEYLPMPDYKKEWEITINCADELKRLDGALVETTGRELKSRLERMWWTKSALDYQDLDYATTTLADNPLTNSATTITVASPAGTYDFPEQGRLRIEDEEILYTGKTPTTFTGCTRGARGTRAVSHAQNTVVNNAYKVLIMGIEERTPAILEDKELEHIVGLSLREV